MSKTKVNRLQQVIDRIEDEDLKQVVVDAFKIEISYRSTDRVNFPKAQLKQVIEKVARAKEINETFKQ